MKPRPMILVVGLVTETGEYDGCLEIHDQFNFGWISWAFKLYGDWTSDSPGFWPVNLFGLLEHFLHKVIRSPKAMRAMIAPHWSLVWMKMKF